MIYRLMTHMCGAPFMNIRLIYLIHFICRKTCTTFDNIFKPNGGSERVNCSIFYNQNDSLSYICREMTNF